MLIGKEKASNAVSAVRSEFLPTVNAFGSWEVDNQTFLWDKYRSIQPWIRTNGGVPAPVTEHAMAEVRKLAPDFDFPALVKNDGANVDHVIVFQPSAFKGISTLLGRTPLSVLRDQLLVRSLDVTIRLASVAPLLADVLVGNGVAGVAAVPEDVAHRGVVP